MQVLSGIVTFADKFLEEDTAEYVRGVIQMMKVGRMIFEDGFIAGEKRGETRGVVLGKMAELVRIIRFHNSHGMEAHIISEIVEWPVEKIEAILYWFEEYPKEDDTQIVLRQLERDGHM